MVSQVAVYERLHGSETRTLVSLCGTPISQDGPTSARTAADGSLYSGQNADAIAFRRPGISMSAEQGAHV